MLDCAVAKRKAKRNARRGTVRLRGDDEREVKTYQEDVAKLKAERRRKEEDAQPKPMVRTVHDCPEAISRLARPEPRPEPRRFIQNSVHFPFHARTLMLAAFCLSRFLLLTKRSQLCKLAAGAAARSLLLLWLFHLLL